MSTFLRACLVVLAAGVWIPATASPAAAGPEDGYCSVCAAFEFTDLPPALMYPAVMEFFARTNDDICYDAHGNLTAHLDSPLFAAAGPGGLIPEDSVLSGFVDGERLCTSYTMKWCARFASRSAGAAVERLLQEGVRSFMTEYLCASLRGAYGFTVRPEADDECFSLSQSVVCQQPARAPFPNCKCENKPVYDGLLPVPYMLKQPGSKPNTSLHCFELTYLAGAEQNTTTVNGSTIVEHPGHGGAGSACSLNDKLVKAEIWADDSKRRYVRRVRLSKSNGASFWMHASWGAPGENTLKVTPLNWGLGEALGGQICLEVHHDIGENEPLSKLCLGGACHLALFGEKECCPTWNMPFRSTL